MEIVYINASNVEDLFNKITKEGYEHKWLLTDNHAIRNIEIKLSYFKNNKEECYTLKPIKKEIDHIKGLLLDKECNDVMYKAEIRYSSLNELFEDINYETNKGLEDFEESHKKSLKGISELQNGINYLKNLFLELKDELKNTKQE